jgi:hypothetical protein
MCGAPSRACWRLADLRPRRRSKAPGWWCTGHRLAVQAAALSCSPEPTDPGPRTQILRRKRHILMHHTGYGGAPVAALPCWLRLCPASRSQRIRKRKRWIRAQEGWVRLNDHQRLVEMGKSRAWRFRRWKRWIWARGERICLVDRRSLPDIWKRSAWPPSVSPAWRAHDLNLGEEPRCRCPRDPRGLPGSSSGGSEGKGGVVLGQRRLGFLCPSHPDRWVTRASVFSLLK